MMVPSYTELIAGKRPSWGHVALRLGAGTKASDQAPCTIQSGEKQKLCGFGKTSFPPLPQGPGDSPVSALSQIPGLRRLQLVAEVKTGVEAMGVDRHALLTPPGGKGRKATASGSARPDQLLST
jgi:hypothetical protein